jgi:hypothetical protein
MPGELQRVGLVAGGDQRQVRVALEWSHHVAELAVDARGNGCLGEARSNGGGHISWRRTPRHFAHRAIGKGDFIHF